MPERPIAATMSALAVLCCATTVLAAPQTVRAQYAVSLNGAPVGVMHESFEARDGRYRIVSETHATGVLALIQRRPGRVTSSGEVREQGLHPRVFEAARGNKDSRRARAEFNWPAQTLTLTHDGRTETVALPAGAQDRLSAMYQFLFLRPEQLRDYRLAMTNGRKIDHYRYTPGQDTTLDTPLGRLAVLHLVKQHAAGETATEIWLSPDHAMMPVRMRIIEGDGSRYEQLIVQLELPPASP
jgi:hypothetical protein